MFVATERSSLYNHQRILNTLYIFKLLNFQLKPTKSIQILMMIFSILFLGEKYYQFYVIILLYVSSFSMDTKKLWIKIILGRINFHNIRKS